jgi:hypothetical protein
MSFRKERSSKDILEVKVLGVPLLIRFKRLLVRWRSTNITSSRTLCLSMNRCYKAGVESGTASNTTKLIGWNYFQNLSTSQQAPPGYLGVFYQHALVTILSMLEADLSCYLLELYIPQRTTSKPNQTPNTSPKEFEVKESSSSQIESYIIPIYTALYAQMIIFCLASILF